MVRPWLQYLREADEEVLATVAAHDVGNGGQIEVAAVLKSDEHVQSEREIALKCVESVWILTWCAEGKGGRRHFCCVDSGFGCRIGGCRLLLGDQARFVSLLLRVFTGS